MPTKKRMHGGFHSLTVQDFEYYRPVADDDKELLQEIIDDMNAAEPDGGSKKFEIVYRNQVGANVIATEPTELRIYEDFRIDWDIEDNEFEIADKLLEFNVKLRRPITLTIRMDDGTLRNMELPEGRSLIASASTGPQSYFIVTIPPVFTAHGGMRDGAIKLLKRKGGVRSRKVRHSRKKRNTRRR